MSEAPREGGRPALGGNGAIDRTAGRLLGDAGSSATVGAVVALMRAHFENDDRSGAERVYQEHATALQQGKARRSPGVHRALRLDPRSR